MTPNTPPDDTDTTRTDHTDTASAGETAQELRDRAVEGVRKRADGARDGLADEVGSVGHAMRTAADELREGSMQERAFASAADALADMSDRLRGKDLGEILHEVNEFGRRNPVSFLGAAALLGFAGMRMAKAGHREFPGLHGSDGNRRDEYAAGAGRTAPMGAGATGPGATGPGAAGTGAAGTGAAAGQGASGTTPVATPTPGGPAVDPVTGMPKGGTDR